MISHSVSSTVIPDTEPLISLYGGLADGQSIVASIELDRANCEESKKHKAETAEKRICAPPIISKQLLKTPVNPELYRLINADKRKNHNHKNSINQANAPFLILAATALSSLRQAFATNLPSLLGSAAKTDPFSDPL
jgi:hypothetical protein